MEGTFLLSQGLSCSLHPGARLMGYASMIYNTPISLESEAQLILESCSLHLITLEPYLCTWPAQQASAPPPDARTTGHWELTNTLLCKSMECSGKCCLQISQRKEIDLCILHIELNPQTRINMGVWGRVGNKNTHFYSEIKPLWIKLLNVKNRTI